LKVRLNSRRRKNPFKESQIKANILIGTFQKNTDPLILKISIFLLMDLEKARHFFLPIEVRTY